MRCQKQLLVCAVVCLANVVRRSVQEDVQRLDTGYTYPVGDKGVGREKDLKCAFWHGGRVHMQLTKMLLQLNEPVPSAMNAIYDFQKNTIVHLAVLYNLKTERIGALWLVHLYVNKAVGYYEHLTNELNCSHDVVVAKMSATHDYIVEKLKCETAVHCAGKGTNRFDWSEKQFAEIEPNTDDVRARIAQNTGEMHEMLTNNNLLAVDNITDFEVSNILLQNNKVRECIRKVILYDVDSFGINVDWINTHQVFFTVGRNIRDLDFASNHLMAIRSYFSLVFDILKVVVLRMSWKILTLIRVACPTSWPGYAHRWVLKLQDFAGMFNLFGDRHIKFLLEAFRDVQIKNIELVDPLIVRIRNELKTMSALLGCDATRLFNQTAAKNYNIAFQEGLDDMVKTECLHVANKFNYFLQENFRNDFGVTTALINYIDEPPPYNLFDSINNLRIST